MQNTLIFAAFILSIFAFAKAHKNEQKLDSKMKAQLEVVKESRKEFDTLIDQNFDVAEEAVLVPVGAIEFLNGKRAFFGGTMAQKKTIYRPRKEPIEKIVAEALTLQKRK